MQPAKILVVDDVPAQRLAIEAALSELGEEIICVGSGPEALRRLLEQDVAVVLLDVNMPDMDGFETAALIRQRPRSRLTPIIFLTADTNEMLAARAYSLGAVDYIFNPFLPDVLRAKVRVFVELSKMHARMKEEAEQRIALSRAEAARAVAEEESHRLRFLLDASSILSGLLQPATAIPELLRLFVPRMADVAAIALADADSTGGLTWMDAGTGGQVRRDPLAAAHPALGDTIQRVLGSGKEERLALPDSVNTRGIAAPLRAGDRIVGALGVCFDRSRRGYVGADADLIASVAARAAIALENSRLYREIQERDRQKDDFLAMLSHELRNPLGAIATAARLLEQRGASSEAAVKAREVVGRQTAHLTRIVDDLLDVARVTTGRIDLTMTDLDFAAVVRRSIDALNVSGRLAGHAVATSLEAATIHADAARVEQVVTNLLVNAVKYTDGGGRIEVTLRAEGDAAVLRVRDTGIGISADVLPRLFQAFTQAPQALDRAQGGLGIGLALARRLVELQGGRIEASSPGPGQGSTFTVRFPRLAVQPPAPEPRLVASAVERPLRVVIVEDNDDVRAMLRTVLELGGHDVHEARTGLEGFDLAMRVVPHLALVDLGLPELDGLELAARIRALPDGERLVLVALTGYGQPKDRQKTLEAGFDVHLVKPVEPERLNEVLSLAARREEERRREVAPRH